MRVIFAALVAISLFGCAARVFNVPLNLPDSTKNKNNVVVKDGRLDKQIYMTVISLGASHIYLLTTDPPMEVALEYYIYNALSKSVQRTQFTKIEMTVEEFDLKNKVGFAKADELYCRIESTVMLYSDNAKPLELRVKTFTKNEENMSPMVATAAKVILDQCLQRHSLDAIDRVGVSR
jgi:hypothetical protein